jgi:hypothetical protein
MVGRNRLGPRLQPDLATKCLRESDDGEALTGGHFGLTLALASCRFSPVQP